MPNRIAQRRGVLRLLLLLPTAGAAWIGRALGAGSAPVEGLYRVRAQVRINGQPAAPGAAVRAGDTVVTGPSGEAVLTVGQDAFLLRESSELQTTGEDLVIRGLRLLGGSLLSVFGKGERRIETRTAVIGIRGTGCYVEAEATRTYVCLCYGSADLMDASGRLLERVRTRHHESPRYIQGPGAQRPIEAARVTNHTDEELILLESLVGRRPPFVGWGDGEYGGSRY
jgi:hypothetical protein